MLLFLAHDEFAAAPLLKKAVDQGVAVLMINDIQTFQRQSMV